MSYSQCIYNKTKHPEWNEDIPQFYTHRNRWLEDHIKCDLPGVKEVDSYKCVLTYKTLVRLTRELAMGMARLNSELYEVHAEDLEAQARGEHTPLAYMVHRAFRNWRRYELFDGDDDNIGLSELDIVVLPDWLSSLFELLEEADADDEFEYSFG